MKNDLMNGTTLVIDRYAFSGVAYTSAKVCNTFIRIYYKHCYWHLHALVLNYCIVLLYCLIVLSYCSVLLYCLIVLSYCIVLLYCLIVLSYCIVLLYCLIVLSYCIVLLYCLIVLSYCIDSE